MFGINITLKVVNFIHKTGNSDLDLADSNKNLMR